jgi:hypothetical protein
VRTSSAEAGNPELDDLTQPGVESEEIGEASETGWEEGQGGATTRSPTGWPPSPSFDSGMMRGASDVLSGWKDKLQAAVASIMPASILGEQQRKLAPPGSGQNSGIDST